MLKWLVTRGPTTAQPPRKVVTDDPLATLRVKTKHNTEQIYAVSRVNPLFHDEEVEITAGTAGEEEEEEEEEEDVGVVSEVTANKEVNLLESPPTDRGSVRSSGYGSKETDSVSDGSDGHDDDLLGAEIEAALKPPPAPSPFSDSHKQPEESVKSLEGNEIRSQDLKDGGNAGASHSVAQLRKSFEGLSHSEKTLPTVISAGGKPVATIVTQHPQFVKAIEVVGMRRTKSLETIQQQRVIDKTGGSSTVPRPIWPRVSSLVENLQHLSNRREQLRELQESVSAKHTLHERIPSPVDILKQDLRYVTSIHVTPRRSLSRAKTFTSGQQPKEEHSRSANNFSATTLTRGIGDNHDTVERSSLMRYFGGEKQNTGFPLISLQPDSLVTEDTLRMMRYGRQDDLMEDENDIPIQAIEREIPALLPDFSQLMYTRGLYATLNRAASLSTKDIVKPPYKSRSRSIDISIPNHKNSAKKKGLLTMKGLWEKSGLKTNGRKLIVDVNDLLDSSIDDEDDEDENRVENLQSIQSHVLSNVLRSSQLQSNITPSTYPNSPTYEDPISFGHRHTSHPVSGTMESRFSDTYAEINDVTGNGIDNPAFQDDSGHHRYFSPELSEQYNNKARFLDPDKLADFQKKISEKLQGAPHHRTQWLDLDEIVIEGVGDKQERRVKFTSDTINPGSLDRRGVGQHHQQRSPPIPGGAVRSIQECDLQTLSGRQLPEVTLQPTNLMDHATGNNRDLWSSSESYRDRFQEAPPGTIGRGRRQQLWETYYGSTGTMDSTYPRHLAPHPNRKAPMCGKRNSCHDFTLDLSRTHKLKVRSVARRKRRRCYIILLVIVAFVVFLGMVVVVSWYCTGGEKFFGPM